MPEKKSTKNKEDLFYLKPETIQNSINWRAAAFSFILHNKRPYFFHAYAHTLKEAEDFAKRIEKETKYLAIAKPAGGDSKRPMIFVSEKGHKLLDWYDFHKKMGNIS